MDAAKVSACLHLQPQCCPAPIGSMCGEGSGGGRQSSLETFSSKTFFRI